MINSQLIQRCPVILIDTQISPGFGSTAFTIPFGLMHCYLPNHPEINAERFKKP